MNKNSNDNISDASFMHFLAAALALNGILAAAKNANEMLPDPKEAAALSNLYADALMNKDKGKSKKK